VDETSSGLCLALVLGAVRLFANVLFVEVSIFIFPENEVQWASNEDRELWEEEQKRLDREWYAIDEGYDGDNPFANLSEDYTKKKEEQLEQRRKKRMSAQQRQINKVIQNLILEKNVFVNPKNCWQKAGFRNLPDRNDETAGFLHAKMVLQGKLVF
jgi:DNA-directed RNA polymerase beta' subunit